MAVLKIFPDKDATLYSIFPTMNTGLDEIVEATETVFAYSDPSPQTSRFLVHFADEDLAAAIDLIPQSLFNSGSTTSTGSWNAKLQCFIATATGLAVTTSIDCFPAAQYWDMGTGRYLDEPISTDGCSWIWAGYSGSTLWQIPANGFPNYPTGATASYTQSLNSSNQQMYPVGGGVWYTGSQYTSSVMFSYRTNKDINLDVTNTVKAWTTSSGTIPTTIIDNYGFILKQRQEFVYNKNYQPELKYFSVDTNTIYPPALQISWNDFVFQTGSSTQTILNTLPATITLAQNPGVFYSESINRFRINARPEYPVQVWQTESVYLNNFYLPTASYYAIKDLETNEYIIDFDPIYTKLSADATSSYFDMYMNFLQPERYYTVLIQSTINGSTIVFNDQYYFKVING
jgi:hypothetical protein